MKTMMIMTNNRDCPEYSGALINVHSYVVKPILLSEFVGAVEQIRAGWELINEQSSHSVPKNHPAGYMTN